MDHYRPSRAFPRVTGPVTIIAYTVSLTGYLEGSGSSSYNSLVDGDKLCNIEVERARAGNEPPTSLKKITKEKAAKETKTCQKQNKKILRSVNFKVRARKVIIDCRHI